MSSHEVPTSDYALMAEIVSAVITSRNRSDKERGILLQTV